MATFKPVIQEAPLQIYASALLFAPENSLVRQHFKEDIPEWTKKVFTTVKDWSPLLHTIIGSTLGFGCVRYSPCCKQAASAGEYRIQLWDVSTWRCLRTLDHPAQDVAFLSDTSFISFGGLETEPRIWCLDTYESEILKFPGYPEYIHAILPSPDGKKLASKGYTKICLYDVDTHESHCLTSHNGHSIFSFSPDSRMIAVNEDDNIWIWDTETKSQLHHFEYPKPKKLRFSLDIKTLFCVSGNGTIQSFALGTENPQTCISFGGNDDNYEESAFSPTKPFVAILSNKSLSVWDLSIGRKITILTGVDFHDLSRGMWQIVWLPKGNKVAAICKNGHIYIWDVATNSLIWALRSSDFLSDVEFSQDERFVITYERSVFRVWDLTIGAPKDTTGLHINILDCISFSPKGELVALAGGAGNAGGSRVLLILKMDTGDLQKLDLPEVYGNEKGPYVACASFSANGEKLIYTGCDRPVAVWDLTNSAFAQEAVNYSQKTYEEVPTIAISPDGNTLASAYSYGVQLVNLMTGKAVRDFKTEIEFPFSLALSPDNVYVAVAAELGPEEKAFQIINIRTGEQTV